MSGKRFSGLERMTTAEFEAAVTHTTNVLNKYPVKYCFPKNIRSKESFGDAIIFDKALILRLNGNRPGPITRIHKIHLRPDEVMRGFLKETIITTE